MTTFMYTTTSSEVQVTDSSAVGSLLKQYYFTVEPTLSNGTFSFFAESEPNGAFDVYETPDQMNSVVEEFLSKLSEYLSSSFEVKCVEVEGDGEPDAWKWSVTSDGQVTSFQL